MNSRIHERVRGALLALSLLSLGTVRCPAQSEYVLTLPGTIRLALQQNNGLQRSALQVDQGQNSLLAARGERQPSLNLSASGSLSYSSQGDASIFDRSGGALDDSLRASLSSNLTLYDGGLTRETIAAAEADLEAIRNTYDRNRQELLVSVVNSFLLSVVRNKQVSIREEELANQMEQLKRIRLDYENGIRVKSEVLRQEALVAQGQGGLIEGRRQFQEALFALKDLLDIPAADAVVCVSPTGIWESVDTLDAPDVQMAMAGLEARLDLEAQRARLTAAGYSLQAARAGRHPSIFANASLGTAYSSSMNGGFAERFIEREPTASAGLVVDLPIFDRRRTRTGIIRSQIQVRQEELIYDNLLQLAQSDLHRAYLNFSSARAQMTAARNQLAAADEALQAESARFSAGVATLLDLNSIRSTRLEAAVAVEQARADLFTSRLGISFEDGSIEDFLLEQLQELNPSTLHSRQ